MGTYTIATVGRAPSGEPSPAGFKIGVFNVTMSGDYAAGGDTGDWSSYFPTQIYAFMNAGTEAANADSGYRLDALLGTNASPVATNAILIQAWNGTTEATGSADLNDVVRRVVVLGR